MNNKSFTLIELAVVIVIMIIVAIAGTITQISSYDRLKLDAAAQKIASDIRAAQELVMDYAPAAMDGTRGASSIVVDFDESLCAANSYCIKSIPEQIITNPVTGQPWQVNIGTEFPGISINSVNLATGGYTMFFFKSPLAEVRACLWQWPCCGDCVWEAELFSTGATIVLQDTKGRSKTIRIARKTGRVTIE